MQLKRAMTGTGTVLPIAPTLIVPLVVAIVMVMRVCALVGR